MPDIGHISHTSGSGGTGPVNRPSSDTTGRPANTSAADSTSRLDRRDSVELSEHARWLDALRRLPDVRAEKIAKLKAEIEAGTYDTDEKLNLALDKMLDEEFPA